MPAGKNKVVIIDTNLWISFLLTKDFSKLDRILSNPSCSLIFSEDLYEEFQSVAQRTKFRKYFSIDDLETLLSKVRLKSRLIPVSNSIHICRDPKDDFLLSLARDGSATHLITGDKDLLDIKRFGKTRIVTMTDFLLKNN